MELLVVRVVGAGWHGFLLDQGSYTTLNVPGSTFTEAWGINDAGQIVGKYGDAAGWHAFVLDQGSYTTIDPPGGHYVSAHWINDAGQIVGDYRDASGYHGFLATPVP
jgi:uncharacterized membrane protein